MLIPEKKEKIISFGNEEEQPEKAYLVLSVVDLKHESKNVWNLVYGRQGVFEEIDTVYREYGTYNFFKSNIISEGIPPTHAISAYTFLRMFIDSGDVDSSSWSILNIEDLNLFISDVNSDDIVRLHIDDDEDLANYAEDDSNHVVWRKING